MNGKQASLDTSRSKKRSRAPLFRPKLPNKKRRAVRRTPSPKDSDTTTSTHFKNCNMIPPTVDGISHTYQLLKEGLAVALPTETVYTICTLFDLVSSSSSLPKGEAIILVKSASYIKRLMNFPTRPFAIRNRPTTPVRLNEEYEMLSRLASHYWPGPMPIFLSTREENSALESIKKRPPFESPSSFIGISCPSHPLAKRVLSQIPVMTGSPTTHTTAFACTCTNVLNGEDTREPFSVPTCQYKDYKHSLWIDASNLTVFVVGISESGVRRVILSKRNDTLQNRVVNAVLNRWKIVPIVTV
jgi:tRNA A37 threonylcarbamoyladenosine synthetase subunit TsaC/SUA5/YrdC